MRVKTLLSNVLGLGRSVVVCGRDVVEGDRPRLEVRVRTKAGRRGRCGRCETPGPGMADGAYWQDLCELLVWEPYLVFERGSGPLRWAAGAHAGVVERILLALADEHREVHLDHQADEALNLVASLRIADRK